jgi:hypothetical protein
MAGTDPLAAANQLRRRLGEGRYVDLLHETFKPRCGEDGKPFTAVHAALLRLPLRGYVPRDCDTPTAPRPRRPRSNRPESRACRRVARQDLPALRQDRP